MTTYKTFRMPIKSEFEDKDGNWQSFNYSSDAVLKEAKLFYHNMDHIGSGYVTRVNGNRFVWPKLQHFFKAKE